MVCLPNLEVLEERDGQVRVEVRGMRARVRGWVEASALPSPSNAMVVHMTFGHRGEARFFHSALRLPPSWPYEHLPAGAPLFDRVAGTPVARVTKAGILVAACPEGRWPLVELSTPWGVLPLRANPRDVVRRRDPGDDRELSDADATELARRCPE
jgi:hypothetical protein